MCFRQLHLTQKADCKHEINEVFFATKMCSFQLFLSRHVRGRNCVCYKYVSKIFFHFSHLQSKENSTSTNHIDCGKKKRDDACNFTTLVSTSPASIFNKKRVNFFITLNFNDSTLIFICLPCMSSGHTEHKGCKGSWLAG